MAYHPTWLSPSASRSGDVRMRWPIHFMTTRRLWHSLRLLSTPEAERLAPRSLFRSFEVTDVLALDEA